jgi:hypothetical protein
MCILLTSKVALPNRQAVCKHSKQRYSLDKNSELVQVAVCTTEARASTSLAVQMLSPPTQMAGTPSRFALGIASAFKVVSSWQLATKMAGPALWTRPARFQKHCMSTTSLTLESKPSGWHTRTAYSRCCGPRYVLESCSKAAAHM